jgi:hypothetical protein
MTTSPPVPKGLSTESMGIWKELTTLHRFEAHELVAFERALVWFDKSDAWLRDAEAAEGRLAASLVKMSMDASNCGLRYWRTLKFTDGTTARRPGRPPGDEWSAKRKAQKLQQVV